MAEPTEQTPPVAIDDSAQSVDTPTESRPETEVATPAEEVDYDIKSKKVTLADLCAKGTRLYSQRQYEEAAEIFSRASILQADINGSETAPENAEILFHYGRSLFKVGQSKSDVLGGPAAAKKTKKPANGSSKPKKADTQAEAEKVTQEGVGIASEQKEENSKPESDAKKPLFQFTGDENFDDSDEEEGAEGEEEQEEEDDDLANAFEILDLARVCYNKRLEQLEKEEEEESGKGKEVAKGESSAVRHIKERLGDTHDALFEISLENEQYPNAIEDGRIALNYKLELYPEESEIIAEAHYKLSLAFEFASVTTSAEGQTEPQAEGWDKGLREQAVKHMELAIKSSKRKLQNQEIELATMASPEDNELARNSIQDMKEVLSDMTGRLAELRNDPIDKTTLFGEESPAAGILGAILGESPTQTQARVEEAKKTANDLTGLVRKKKKDDTNGKRKAEEPAVEEDTASKKTKTSDDDA